jgi:uncharacterized protein (TIGR02118 family)
MIRVSVLFPATRGVPFDKAYYFTKHLPLIARLIGPALKGISIEEGVSGAMPGSSPQFVMTSHFSFESLDAFQAAFYPHAQDIMNDVKNVTRAEPIVQIGEVKYSK